MSQLFKEVKYPLSKLVEDIDIGEIALPELQRPFVWDNAQVRDLFDSMYKGYPIGYLLFWEALSGATTGTRNIGENVKQRIARLLVVDGQQRLTALFTVLKGTVIKRKDFSEERIRIAFSPISEQFEVADAATDKNGEYISDITELWKSDGSMQRFGREYVNQLKTSHDVSSELEDQIYDRINRLAGLKSYPFMALELAASVNDEQVADVFVRINSKGKVLKKSDFILTLMSVFWEDGRKELEEFCVTAQVPSDKPSPFNDIIRPDPEDMLRVTIGNGFKRGRLKYAYLILRGKDLETEVFSEELREKQFGVLRASQAQALDLTNWHDFLKIPMSAGFLSSDIVSSKINLLFCYNLYLIGYYVFKMDRSELRGLLTKWVFMASITGRYTGSSETAIEKDLVEISGLNSKNQFVAYLENIMTQSLTEDFWNITLPNKLATTASTGASLFAYNASLNILNAKALFSNLLVRELSGPSTKAKKANLERHHLFPKNYLKKNGVEKKRDTNQIANFALIEWGDNIKISDSPPAEYFPKLFSKYSEKEKADLSFFHALPDKWYEMPYTEFLAARRVKMAAVIRAAYECLNLNEKSKAVA